MLENETILSWLVAGAVSIVVFLLAWFIPGVSSWVWFTLWLIMWFLGFGFFRFIYRHYGD